MRSVKDEKQYKVVGFSYTRPKKTFDSRGEVILYQEYVAIYIGCILDFQGIPKRVKDIEFDEKDRMFKIYLEKGGLRVVPYSRDMEMNYEEVKSNGAK